jgi:uncharacterized protein (TIGR01370 family)
MKKFLLSLLIPSALCSAEMAFPWVVYYSDQAEAKDFEPYNPVILESDADAALVSSLAGKKDVLGYVNLGEAEEWRPWFKELKMQGLLVRENPNWKGSWIVDIRKPAWKNHILERAIPMVLAKGFNGLFYDQLDVVITLEQEDPVKYQGMIAAAIDLVKSIRQRFPGKKIMMNRAYEIIEQVGKAIDYELAESLYTDYDFENKTYSVRSQDAYDWQMNYLNKGRKNHPHLVIFSLDYWDPDDTEMYLKIYAIERKNCLRPYVSTISLDKIISEPKGKY